MQLIKTLLPLLPLLFASPSLARPSSSSSSSSSGSIEESRRAIASSCYSEIDCNFTLSQQRVRSLNPHKQHQEEQTETNIHAPISAINPSEKSMSNAERLQRGLPLKRPTIRSSKTAGSKRSDPSAGVMVSKVANIQVYDSSNDSFLGYVSKNYLLGQQSSYNSDVNQALQVGFNVPYSTGQSNLANLMALNSVANGGYSYFGLIQGRDDIDDVVQSGSYQYLYFANTNPTPPGSTPQNVGNSYTATTGLNRDSESAIWNIDVNTGSLSAQWINPDGNPATISYWSQSTALYAGGDQGAFHSRYPAPVTGIYFKLTNIV